MDYRRILTGTDAEARDEYDYDPRVALQSTTKSTGNTNALQPASHSSLPTPSLGGQSTIEELSQPQLQNTLTLPVQSAPSMVPKKHGVIIDSAQRDWTIQQDAYSNIFSFGTQIPLNSVGPQTPYYFNNPTIPLAAWETPINPPTIGSGALATLQTFKNNNPQTFPNNITLPSYVNTTNQGLVKPTYGWKIVLSNGQLVHTPTPINYSDPNTRVIFYPIYNPADPAGAQVGIDIQPKQYGTTGYTYATQLALSNITDIRLSRAILPIRGTQPYLSSAFSPSNIEYPLSFHNQPYIMMSIQNLKGNYLGGSEITQQTFSVLTQNTRNYYEGNVPYQCQFADFYSWNNESYEFKPPLSKLSNANIQLHTPAGDAFSQLDNLNIIDMALDTVNIGKVKFFVTQSTTNTVFGDCNAFLGTDIRAGDEITFYTPALTQVVADPSCSIYHRSFFSLLSNNFIVTDICSADFVPRSIFPRISRIGTSFTAVPKVTGYSGMSNAVVTICGLLQRAQNVCLQQYTSAPINLSFATARSLSKDYAIPIMNLNAQATFVLEVTTMEPDSTNIQRIIPN